MRLGDDGHDEVGGVEEALEERPVGGELRLLAHDVGVVGDDERQRRPGAQPGQLAPGVREVEVEQVGAQGSGGRGRGRAGDGTSSLSPQGGSELPRHRSRGVLERARQPLDLNAVDGLGHALGRVRAHQRPYVGPAVLDEALGEVADVELHAPDMGRVVLVDHRDASGRARDGSAHAPPFSTSALPAASRSSTTPIVGASA